MTRILIVGPDGAGKSTVAEGLAERATSSATDVARAHWRPGIVPPRGAAENAAVTDPHGEPPRGALPTVVRLVLLTVDFLAGYATRWRRVSRDGLLIIERGWYDMVVDPRRYRLPAWSTPLLRTIGAAMPRAQLTVLLTGEPAELEGRTHEIGTAETARQIEAWRRIAPQTAHRVLEIDTTRTPPGAAIEIGWAAVREDVTTVWRRVPLAARRLDVRAIGETGGAFAIHRAHRRLAWMAARLGRLVWRTGMSSQTPTPVPDMQGLADRLGIPVSGAVALRSSAPHRWIIGLSDGDALVGVAKVGPPADPGLRHEAETLRHLASIDVPFVVPRIIWAGAWHGRSVLALAPIPHDPDARVPLDEVVWIATVLAEGPGDGSPMFHGDLAPWNVLRTDSCVGVIDWEEAGFARLPLHDLTHYVVRTGALLRRWTPAEACDLLTGPDSPGARHLQALGNSPDDAGSYVEQYLDRTRAASRTEDRFRSALAAVLRPRL